MKKLFYYLLLALFSWSCAPESPKTSLILEDSIQYHPVRVAPDSSILPWYSEKLGQSYDTALMLVWNFWKNMELDSNGLKYYMNHQVWRPEHDMRGLGGDQINMALSSWTLLYQYTGDSSIIQDMRYMADEYLARSLSDAKDAWPFIPYPYNTTIHSGKYDGDMRDGKGSTQPDKAGNFGYELISLYKITGEQKYLEAAKKIGYTLARYTKAGDQENSPLPFRVNAKTGKTGRLLSNTGSGETDALAGYTANWTGTLMLFRELEKIDKDQSSKYKKAFDLILAWMKEYPLKTNKWGPFFEDIPGWSDTQTNAITFAMFMMQNRDLFPDWKNQVKGIFDWTYKELGNHEYSKYKVTVMNEQTVYRVPGNSHSSRQASMELLYTLLSGDTSFYSNAVKTLNWATYTVAEDGRNRYIRDDIWLTDGYGDYVRHYLRSMAVFPELAPDHKNKLLESTSVIAKIQYTPLMIKYSSFDAKSTEKLRLLKRPSKVTAGGSILREMTTPEVEGYTWTPLKQGGVLTITKVQNEVEITL